MSDRLFKGYTSKPQRVAAAQLTRKTAVELADILSHYADTTVSWNADEEWFRITTPTHDERVRVEGNSVFMLFYWNGRWNMWTPHYFSEMFVEVYYG